MLLVTGKGPRLKTVVAAGGTGVPKAALAKGRKNPMSSFSIEGQNVRMPSCSTSAPAVSRTIFHHFSFSYASILWVD